MDTPQDIGNDNQNSQNNTQHLIDQMNRNFESFPLFWGYYFFAEHFRDAPPRFHLEIMDAAQNHDKLAVVAPRGHAKSTILSFLYVLHRICFGKKRFIVMFSNTKDKAANFLDRIKTELKENQLLHIYYGKPEFIKDSAFEMILKFPEGNTIRVVSRGEDGIQNIRGEIKGAWRPDLMIFDDVEYQELVDNPDRRRKLKTDFNEAAIPAGDIKLCQYIAIGTILHFDALIANLISKDQYKDWHKLFYTAVIDESKQSVLWSDRIPFSYLMQIKRDNPLTYAKEYQNNPIAGENTRFSLDMFQYWKDTDNGYILLDNKGELITKGSWINCVPAIACDLAWSTKKTADETVIMSCILTPEGYILVYHYHNERGMRPERFCNLLFNQVNHLKELTHTRPNVGLEKAMLERVSQHLLKTEMRKRNEFFIIKDLKWEHDKISRIEIALENRYSNNVMFHKHGMGELEEQLLRFPYAAHDDICDSLSGCVGMLKYGKNVNKTKSTQSEDSAFDWWRNNALPNNKKKKSSPGLFLFGKTKEKEIISKKTFTRL